MQSNSLDLAAIKEFLMRANMPHAEGTAEIIQENDGSRTIEYSKGDYRLHNNFFGGEPYGGRLVIFYKDQPVFIEVYYGQTSKPAGEVYDFLREALRHPDYENPFRGPATYTKDAYIYKSTTEGDVASHTVKEFIYEADKEIYSAIIVGGLVDQNARGSM